MARFVPAVLPSSREDLEKTLAMITAIPAVDRVQIDAVDGRFASPASWPYAPDKAFRTFIAEPGAMLPYLDRIAYEVDLMSLDGEKTIGTWLDLGVTRLTFHIEGIPDVGRFLASVCRRYGASGFTPLVSFGLALNIDTDLASLEPHLSEVSYIQFMGITRIGRQGQPFDHRVLKKIHSFRSRHPEVVIQVDGGVSLDTARPLLALGVSDLIVGSGIVRASDPAASFAALESLQSPYGV